MIEITHKQARYLIHQSADAPLAEAQWSALQAHLETCAACRSYRERLAWLERGLRRGLLARWRYSGGPSAGLVEVVLAARTARQERLSRFTRLGLGLLALLVLLGAAWALRYRTRVQPPAAPLAPTPVASPTPSEPMQGVVAYTTIVGDRRQIQLMNLGAGGQTAQAQPGGESSRIGQGDGEDIWPAWSPDGEWLAFLSNRSGSWQLYIINVAGTRLTQLTNDPNIVWRGPLSWSYEGKWITLTGVRLRQDNTPWIYLVQVGGRVEGMTGPRAISQTRGAPGFARFSPSQPMLAVQRPDGGLQVYNYAAGLWVDATPLEHQAAQRSAPGGAFGWSFNGASLVYLADGPFSTGDIRGPVFDTMSWIYSSGVLGPYVLPDSLERDRLALDALPGEGVFRSVSYLPGGGMVATLWDPRQNGCWTVRLVKLFPTIPQTPAASLDGLCVSGGLGQASWTADRKWLVLAAQPAGLVGGSPLGAPIGDPAIYALRIPEQPVSGLAQYRRLAILPLGLKFSEAGENQPAVRPNGSALSIEPDAARPPLPAVTKRPVPPGDLSGDLLLTQRDGPNSAILSVRPDGKDRRTLLPADAANTCPTWSPDRSEIAFLSDRGDPERARPAQSRTGENGRGLNEVYVMNPDGGDVVQLTFPIVPYPAAGESANLPVYDCPVWSPDGKMIAAVARSGGSARMAIVSPKVGLLRSVIIDPTSPLAAPLWTKDSRALLLAKPAGRGSPASVGILTTNGTSGVETVLMLKNGWDDVQGMTLSEDGHSLALILVRYATASRAGAGSLQIYNLGTDASMVDIPLSGYDPSALKSPGKIDWETNLWLTLVVPSGPFARHKAVITRYIPFETATHTVAFVEDALYGWSLREHWFVFSTESGLWGLADHDGFNPDPQPLLLSEDEYSWLDWR